MSFSAPQGSFRGGYLDIEALDDVSDSGHVRAVISQRRGHAKFTCAFFKVFSRDGQEERTSFFEPERHFAGIVRLLPRVKQRIIELEAAQLGAGRR